MLSYILFANFNAVEFQGWKQMFAKFVKKLTFVELISHEVRYFDDSNTTHACKHVSKDNS